MFPIQGFIKYTKNTSYLLIEKIIRALVSFFVWAQVIRYLGPEQFGIFNYALSLVLIFNILSEVSAETVVVREIIRDYPKQNIILGSAFALKFFAGLLAYSLVVGVSQIASMDAPIKILIALMAIEIIFGSFNVIDYYFQSQVLSQYIVIPQLLSLGLTTFLCLSFIHLKLPLFYLAFIIVMESAVIAAGLAFFYIRFYKSLFIWKIDFSVMKRLFQDSWPLLLSGAAAIIYMRIDQIMIKEMLNAQAVGYYAAAVKISEVFYPLPIILTSSLFPAIVHAKQRNHESYTFRLKALFCVLFYLALGLSLIITLFAPVIIRLLYGEAFLPSVSVLILHVWASLFIFWGMPRGKWAITENLQMYVLAYTVTGAILNIALNFILIPRMNIQGAALATIIAQAWATLLSSLCSKKTREIFFVQLESINIFKVFKGRLLFKE